MTRCSTCLCVFGAWMLFVTCCNTGVFLYETFPYMWSKEGGVQRLIPPLEAWTLFLGEECRYYLINKAHWYLKCVEVASVLSCPKDERQCSKAAIAELCETATVIKAERECEQGKKRQ